MNRVETLLKELRDVYEGSPWYGDSLRKTLARVSEAEANERPLARAHSIAELVGHITTWIDTVHRRIDGEVVHVTAAENFPYSGNWKEQVRRLDEAYAALVARVSSMSDADLDGKVAGKRQTAEYAIRGVVQHCIYHQGQIALLRK